MKIMDIMIKKFIKNKQIEREDFNEIKQILVEKYLGKQSSIKDAFTYKSKIETYLSAVIYRMILEIIREQYSYKNRVKRIEKVINDDSRQTTLSPEEILIIEDEKIYLKRVIETFGAEKDKVLLFLKIYFQINYTAEDINNYCRGINADILPDYSGPDKRLTDKETYEYLCKICLYAENKEIFPDAIRMYLKKITDKLIARMNGKYNRAFYTKESLGILMEMVYQKN